LESGFVAALPAEAGPGLAAAGFVPAAGLAVPDGCASAGTAASARAAERRNPVRIMAIFGACVGNRYGNPKLNDR
jgi:hypothetical protein